jgi:hypothetical protein
VSSPTIAAERSLTITIAAERSLVALDTLKEHGARYPV